MKIFDCFMYNDEDLLLDLRLNSLNNFIEKFIITEASYTHSGIKKKLNFNINNFKKFKDKIHYIVVEDQPKDILELKKNDNEETKGEKLILNGMARDYFQRENLNKGLKNVSDEDLILISDLDEIPNIECIDRSNVKNNILIFEQKIFYYKLNLLYNDYIWHGTKGTKFKNFKSPQWLRNIKSKKYSFWRIDILFSKKKYTNLSFIKNGGWHFTCLKSPLELETKLSNFAHHYEFEESGLKLNDIKRFIEEKRVIYDYNVDQKTYKWSGKRKLKKVGNEMLPKYISANLNKYQDWLD